MEDIELRICAFESGLTIDVSTRNYSITEDADSDSEISKSTKILEFNIPTTDKLIIINNRKEALHGAQTISMILILTTITYFLPLLLFPFFTFILLCLSLRFYSIPTVAFIETCRNTVTRFFILSRIKSFFTFIL